MDNIKFKVRRAGEGGQAQLPINRKTGQMKIIKKKCKVVRLPTKDKLQPNPAYRLMGKKVGDLILVNDSMVGEYAGNDILQPQHLYITSEEEIKEGDWYYDNNDNRVYQAITSNQTPTNYQFKIIATTDKIVVGHELEQGNSDSYLYLPQIAQSFIKEYCGKGGIDEVMVEFQSKCSKTGTECGDNMNCQHMCDEFIIKTNSNNEITAHLIKNTWSRGEVEGIVTKAIQDTNSAGMRNVSVGVAQWIKENL